ncbi:diphosphoinositol polyphosphate phosphohydrolase 1 isoform X1 [Salmo salar]|uniref:diphosphoinositol-polyphosphate diphosphatase n=2 Tax=Salmo TaxID=8028 RepID=A0A1S3LM04_SALSA|nr:diphosphoinositol polyphosphate phosphohydrolase 1 isoform X1 [Salmo salar]|eukprot:XP_013991911.1 PREDICTED: diphosphoinositol polyphosphate phosphohydrolase 1-like [Salmo salar]
MKNEAEKKSVVEIDSLLHGFPHWTVTVFLSFWFTFFFYPNMMKIKSNQTRIYDGDGYKKRAACLCFRNESEEEVLLVSSSRTQDKWIVPGGGMEPEEEPNVAAVREVCEEAGVKGTLGRLLGIFENTDRKHRTYVYVLMVTEMLEDWEDSVNIGRKREWFKTDDASRVLQCHKPVQASYFEALQQGCLSGNMTPLVATIGGGDHSPTYNINHNSRSSIR